MRFKFDDTTRSVEANAVSHFRVTDLISQNVVSRIITSKSSKLSPEGIRGYIGWVTSLSDGASFADDHQIDEIAQRISQGELILLAIDPSWGAEVVIIAQSFSVSANE
jgi:hypothetical protein